MLCDAIQFMRHKVGAHKVRQIAERNDRKNLAISTFENKFSKAIHIAKVH